MVAKQWVGRAEGTPPAAFLAVVNINALFLMGAVDGASQHLPHDK